MNPSRKVLFLSTFLCSASGACLNAEIVRDDAVKGISEDPRGNRICAVSDIYVPSNGDALEYFLVPGNNELDLDKFTKANEVPVCPFYYSTALNRRLVSKEGLAYHMLPQNTDSEKQLKQQWAQQFEAKMGALEKRNVSGETQSWPTWVAVSELDRDKILQDCSAEYESAKGVSAREIDLNQGRSEEEHIAE